MGTHFHIPPERAKEIINDALKVADHYFTDQLDCSKSLARQRTDKSVSDVLTLALDKPDNTYWNFIYRGPMGREMAYYDIGCRVTGNIDYFIWIQVDVLKALEIARKYKLNPLL